MIRIYKVFNFLYKKAQFFILSFINMIVPKSSNTIYLFDKRFRKDNIWAIANYLSENDVYSKYKIYYYTKSKNVKLNNIKFVSNPAKALWIHIRAKYVFYAYRDIIQFKNAKNQNIIDTMHGSPLKCMGYLTGDSKFKNLWKFEDTFTHILCVSDFFREIIQKGYGATQDQCVVTGYPRNDIIFKDNKKLNNFISDKQKFSKIILWMPTFRNKFELGNIPDLDKAFPLLNMDNVVEFNDFLATKDMLLVIKPHPNQLKVKILEQSFSNIMILTNGDLFNKDVELYELFSQVDVLLSDYSSVYFDFLLTGKPIGFVLDDLDKYNGSRGFTVENPLELMPGEKIYNINDLQKFLEDIYLGKDSFVDERAKIAKITNKFQDGNSTRRLLDYLGI